MHTARSACHRGSEVSLVLAFQELLVEAPTMPQAIVRKFRVEWNCKAILLSGASSCSAVRCRLDCAGRWDGGKSVGRADGKQSGTAVASTREQVPLLRMLIRRWDGGKSISRADGGQGRTAVASTEARTGWRRQKAYEVAKRKAEGTLEAYWNLAEIRPSRSLRVGLVWYWRQG
ncbi:hypothetical protein AK812_SmicGene17120 [Symbiodinium microadriaticum]|uniref:Uncharacterized protein n=1 Tax=Symbiodinium microadriaticum TaxID=2951 RepID=A0A1Q9DYH4_SYMMI|nr:hypothetical protein AK812_SmicGene17120 [Symbiodinium microadriaticum]